MKVRTILLVLLILAAIGVAVVAAKAGSPDNGMGQQVRNENQTQDQFQNMQEPVRNQTREQEPAQNRTRDQDRLQNQTQGRNVTLLHQQIQERKQEQANQSAEQQRVHARYSNVSAFVHMLLNESQNRELLGEGPNGIGPQVSEYAREFNNSVRAQIQAEERIQNRNAFVRFFAGGDEDAARILEQETIRNQERILEMQQLINQCEDCDPQVKEMLEEQLQEMVALQTRLQQLAQKEKQDKGVVGWLWK